MKGHPHVQKWNVASCLSFMFDRVNNSLMNKLAWSKEDS